MLTPPRYHEFKHCPYSQSSSNMNSLSSSVGIILNYCIFPRLISKACIDGSSSRGGVGDSPTLYLDIKSCFIVT